METRRAPDGEREPAQGLSISLLSSFQLEQRLAETTDPEMRDLIRAELIRRGQERETR